MFQDIISFAVTVFEVLSEFGHKVLDFFTTPIFQHIDNTIGFNPFWAYLITLLPDEWENFVKDILFNSVFSLMFGSGLAVFVTYVFISWIFNLLN